MLRPRWGFLFLSLFFHGGCIPSRDSLVEQHLLAAGFMQYPPVTPDLYQKLMSLPPKQMILQSQGSKVSYIYADPFYCQCLYVGDRRAYGKFQYLMVLQQQADQAMATSAMAHTAANVNFMAATTPPPYWYPPYYPYYYSGQYGYGRLSSPSWNSDYYPPRWNTEQPGFSGS
jgi:hypothetical protein